MHQRARQRDPLFQPFRQMRGGVTRAVAHVERVQRGVDRSVRVRQPVQASVDEQIAADVEALPETGRLGKQANAAPQPRRIARGQRLAADADGAAARPDQPGNHPQGRRLAGAIRSEEGEDLTRRKLEGDVLDGDTIAETAREMRRRQHL